MSSIAEHKRRIKEHLEELQDAVNISAEKRPATIGFHTSACAVELLEMYLHLSNLISTGKKVNHLWFTRPQEGQKIGPLIERKLTVSFPDKEKVYELFYTIEEARDTLIYGKGTKAQVVAVLDSFMQLKAILERKIKDRGEEIE